MLSAILKSVDTFVILATKSTFVTLPVINWKCLSINIRKEGLEKITKKTMNKKRI